MPLHQLIFDVMTLAACLYAIARGGAPERLTSVGFLVAFILTNLAQGPASAYADVEWQVATIDTALLVAVLLVALGSCRFWGLAMASMMVINVFGHVARLMDSGIIARAYYVLVVVISYPMVALLVAATWRHRVRLRRYGVDYSWVWQLPPAYRMGWLAVPDKDGETRQ